jgi:hypothetical protein
MEHHRYDLRHSLRVPCQYRLPRLNPSTSCKGFCAVVHAELDAGTISRSEAARRLDCGYATVLRLLNDQPSDLPVLR